MQIDRRLLIDFNNLSIRNLFADTKTDHVKENFAFHKHLVLTSILSSLKKFNPFEVLLAVDDVANWRKLVYPKYKANRKVMRDASDFDWKAYYKYIDEFLKDLKELPFKILKVSYTEADDIIAVLSKKFYDKENIIVTADKDYIQLLKYSNNKLFDPIKKKFIEDKNPFQSLQIKLLTGDKGDNVPSVRDRMGEKTAFKILESGQLNELLKDETFNKNFIRNKKLISFEEIPETVQKAIIKTYDEYKLKTGPQDYYSWFIKHRLRKLSEDLSIYLPILNDLKNKKESGDALF